MKGGRRGGGGGRRMPEPKHLINEVITAPEMMVIGVDGEKLGVLSRADALAAAESAGLDLVQVGAKDGLIIAKIIDHGKVLYDKKKQDSRAKKTQKIIQIKEVKFRPNIGEQDYQIKLRRAVQFFEDGKRVKFTLHFRRGRESMTASTVGAAMFSRIHDDLHALSLGSLLEEKEQRGKLLWSKVYYLKGK